MVLAGSGDSAERRGVEAEGSQPQGRSILQKLKDVFWSDEDKDSKEKQKM